MSCAQVRRATTELGGVRAVNCKSGKDRTAIELSVTCPQQAVEAGVIDGAQQWALQTAMQVSDDRRASTVQASLSWTDVSIGHLRSRTL